MDQRIGPHQQCMEDDHVAGNIDLDCDLLVEVCTMMTLSTTSIATMATLRITTRV